MRIKSKLNFETIFIVYSIIYVYCYRLFDEKIGRLPKYIFFLIIFYGCVKYFISKIEHKNLNNKVIFIIFSSCFFYFVITSLLVSNSEQLVTALYEYPFYLLFSISMHYFVSRCNLDTCLKTFCYIGIIVSLLAMYENFSGSYILGNPIDSRDYILNLYGAGRAIVFGSAPMLVGTLLAVSSLVCFYYFYINKKIKYLIYFVLNFIGVVMSGSRGPLLCLVIALIFYYLNNSRSSLRKKINKILKISFILLLLIFTFYIFSRFNVEVNKYWNSIVSSIVWNDSDMTNYTRLSRWIATLEAIKNNLFFGAGPASTGKIATVVTESGVLKRLYEVGLVGFMLYYLFLYTVISKGKSVSKENYNPYYSVALSVTIFILVYDIFLQITENLTVNFVFWFFVYLLYSTDNKQLEKRKK